MGVEKKRYIVKKTTEPMRGQSGKLDVWYIYDSKEKRICTATSPFKPDIEKMCEYMEERENKSSDDSLASLVKD